MKKGIQKGDVKVGDVIRFTHNGTMGVRVIAEIVNMDDYPVIKMSVIGLDDPTQNPREFFHPYAEFTDEDRLIVDFYNVGDIDYRWQLFKEDQLDLFNETH